MAKIDLSKISTKAPPEYGKEKAKEETITLLQELNELQYLLYAESKHSVLVILQGMDASGKDGAIRKVFGTLNPQGVSVISFKVPTVAEAAHDFLWRVHPHAPSKGGVHVFNRSHYEDIIVTRVHNWCDDETARKRMKAINDFEELLKEHNNTQILKFYLHISKEEQHQRLEERIHDPKKQWKYNERDFEETKLWDKYMGMYQDCFEHCSVIPWTIVPADQNWYKIFLIAKTLTDRLKSLDMKYPTIKKNIKVQPVAS